MQSKLNVMGLEDHPTRDEEQLHMMLVKNFDVRHMRNLLNFADKFRSSNCNEHQCPRLKQRWNKHIQDHHAVGSSMKQPSVLHTNSPIIKVRNQSISASSTLSKMRVPTFITRQSNDARAAQTDLTSEDLTRLDTYLKKKIENPVPRIINSGIHIKGESKILRISETRSVIPDKSFYKEHLKEIADHWLKDVPMHITMTDKDKELQVNALNNLIETIYRLAADAGDQNYEVKVKHEIDECLENLPMWSPGAENDKIQFTSGLRDDLWLKINNLNSKYLVNTGSNIVIDECNDITYRAAISSHNSATNTIENEIIVDSNHTGLSVDENIYEKEIINWLNVKLNDEDIDIFQTAELMLKGMAPLLTESVHNAKYKLLLKGNIFGVLEGLSLNASPIKNKILYLNRCAEELANIIISIQIRSETKPRQRENIDQNALINRIEKVSDCIGPFRMTRLVDIEEEISNTIIDDVHTFNSNNENNTIRNNGSISQVNEISDSRVKTHMSESMKSNVKTNTVAISYHTVTPQLSGILSVYTSKEYSFAATSTPKRAINKDIPKLNAEEVAYMDKVAELVRSWMNTLPKQYNEDKNYKETIIYDLAGDIMDEVKLKQLSPEFKSDSDKYLSYITYRWICRFDFFENINDCKPMVKEFLNKLKKLPIPTLTRPQHGSRQTMQNIKHTEGEMGREDFVAKGIDVLEDQISVWMNEQPSEIYVKKDKGARNKQVHELALNLQDKLRNKRPDSEIDQDINEWLIHIVKPKEKENIGILSHNLKDKIKNAPQDETLEGRVQNMKRERRDYYEARNQPQPQVNTYDNKTNETVQDPDNTMKEFIMKFMEHNYDIYDPMARGAFSHLLKVELRKLTPQTRKEVYDNLSKSIPHEDFLPSKLSRELEYIKLISDWLRNIPIASSYNRVGNKERVDFVNDLARNIAEVEEQRLQDSTQMDFDLFISSVISQSIRTYQLPIPPEHKHNEQLMAEQLLNKIVAARVYEASTSIETDSSIRDDTGNIEQNLSEFIEQYIRVNGREIADDAVKLEAWSARLLKEIKKMIHENEDPNTLCKAQVYNRFIDVPIPGYESVKIFGLELEYVKEISEWLKNLPLLSIANEPDAQNKRIEMISELAEKMAERTVKKSTNPNDSNIDSNAVEYVTNWILKLPLDTQQEIVLPIATQQLLNRIDRVNKKPDPMESLSSQSLQISERKDKSLKSPKDRKPPCCISKSNKDPGKVVVDAIENFSIKLPLHGDKETVKAMKDNITKCLYQKICELNVDPRVFNDNLLYEEMFQDEIDTQLENVPQNSDLQNQRENLVSNLMNTILEAKTYANVNAAGENYKHKLETTIDASIPNPYQSIQELDPGFEIYKNHVANMFILENFDHGNDGTKIKYEKMIRHEINKYSENAQNKNALPMSKDQIYNELYSTLFKVPRPCGRVVTDEVEEVKTRYDIQTWFDNLPLREPTGMHELLDRDKIITTLAKRINEMEKQSNSNEKIRKEAEKWLNILPLLPGQDKNIEEFVRKLEGTLKSTVADRKCVTTEPKTQDSKVKAKKSKGILGTSQTAGPSSAGKNWVSPPSSPEGKPCCIRLNQQKPADAIIEIVEKWCQDIPTVLSEEENKVTKDNLITRIIMKISELNTDPEFSENDLMFCELLDEELDKLLSNLLTRPEFQESIPAKKNQLIDQLKSITPLMKAEKAKHEYKEDLKNTVSSILTEPLNTSEDKLEQFNELKNDIIENFVQYHYDRDDEIRQLYINQVHDAVLKYFQNYKDQSLKNQDPLIVRNQLMCELAKIPIPSIGAIQETVEEIKMKKEVEVLFDSLPSPKGDPQKETLRKQLKGSLSIRLYDLERSGHSCSTDSKMKSEISRCLKKLDIKDDPQLITSFVDNLRSNEESRKVPPSLYSISLMTTGPEETSRSNHQITNQTGQSYGCFQRGVTMASSIPPQGWESQAKQSSHSSPGNRTPDAPTGSPYAPGGYNRSLGQSDQDYDRFSSGVVLSSSIQGIQQPSGNINQDNSVTPTSAYQTPNFSELSVKKLPQLNPTQYESCRNQSASISQAGPRSNISGPGQTRQSPGQDGSSSYQTPQSPCQLTPNSQYATAPQSSDQSPQFALRQNQMGHFGGPISLSPGAGNSPHFFNAYQERRTFDHEFSPAQQHERSLGQSSVNNYDQFSDGVILRSSLAPNQQPNTQLALPGPAVSNSQSRVQDMPCCTGPQDSQMTSSSLFDAPRASQIGNERQFYARPLANQSSGPNDTRQSWSQSSYDGINFLMAERPHSLDTDGVCKCVKRILKSCRGRPPCSMDMDEYCDECGGFGPMWWRMSPGFIFY